MTGGAGPAQPTYHHPTTVPSRTVASLRGNSSAFKHALQVCRTRVLELPRVPVSTRGRMAGSSVAPLLQVVTNPQSTQVKRSTVAFVCLDDSILCILLRTVSVEAVKGMTRGGFRGRRGPDGAFGGVSTGMSLASKRAWATRAVASKDISSPLKANSKPDVSPPIVRYGVRVIAMYSRSWHYWDKCRLLLNVHAHRTLDNWYGSSARQGVSCVPPKTDCYLCTFLCLCLCLCLFPCLCSCPCPCR